MRVAREVRENGFGSAERLLRIDHPFRSPEQDEEGGERIDIGERCVPAAKLESASCRPLTVRRPVQSCARNDALGRIVAQEPGGEGDAHHGRFHRAGRDVDNEPLDFAAGNPHQLPGDVFNEAGEESEAKD